MAIHFGTDKIKEIYVGSDKIKEVYYGSEKVWGGIVAIPDGYWVHKDTGVITYFGLEDSSISGGIMSSPSWRLDCSEVNIPEGVTSLGTSCFEGGASLTSITLPESVTGLGNRCFFGCASLTSINIPEGVTSLGSRCFEDCPSLTSITLPESVTSIEAYCFRYCSSLILVTVLPATPPTLASDAFRDTNSSFSIKVRSPYVDAYKAATNWIEYASKISAI